MVTEGSFPKVHLEDIVCLMLIHPEMVQARSPFPFFPLHSLHLEYLFTETVQVWLLLGQEEIYTIVQRGGCAELDANMGLRLLGTLLGEGCVCA